MGRTGRTAFALALLGLGLALIVLAGPRDALAALGAAVAEALAWLFARDLLPGPLSPGLLLVLGGVLVMGVVALVALFGSALEPPVAEVPPARSVRTALPLAATSPRDVYRGPRDLEFERGRATGARVEASSLDAVLDLMVETEMGEPRIVRSLPGFLKLDLHECRGCGREGASGHGVEGCAFECGYIESAFTRALGRTAVVHEVRCRASGAPACEFEVWT